MSTTRGWKGQRGPVSPMSAWVGGAIKLAVINGESDYFGGQPERECCYHAEMAASEVVQHNPTILAVPGTGHRTPAGVAHGPG